LIVSFHFGDEYKPIHNDRQELLAHLAIDNGAKIVVGHHPHVAQDTEVYSPESCAQISCVGYIMYSLGNFIFDQKFSTPTMQGLLVQIRLDKQGGMSVTKNITKQNKFFQIERIVLGREEKIKLVPASAPAFRRRSLNKLRRRPFKLRAEQYNSCKITKFFHFDIINLLNADD